MSIAIVLAGGNGQRMGSTIPKQFLELYDKPIIAYTLEVCTNHPEIEYTVICVHKSWVEHTKDLIEKFELKNCEVVIGGESRADSTMAGIEYVRKQGASDDDIVLTHDAVRPFWDNRMISEGIREAKKHGAVDVCVKTNDTIVAVDEKMMVTGFPKRSELYNGQTPQIFKLGVLEKAHKIVKEKNIPTTCDCSVTLAAGFPVKVIEGDYENIKMTTKADFDLAYRILEKKEIRHEPKIY